MGITLDKSDFDELHYSLIFMNQTSGTEFKEYKKIIIEELLDNGLIFIVPTNTCNASHNLTIFFYKDENPKIPKKISAEGKNKGVVFTANGKITSKTTNEDNKDFSTIEFKFGQYDKFGWEDLINEYNSKQEKIMELF